jgi:carboxylesterase type B
MQAGDPNAGELPAWLRYDAANRSTTLLDEECRVEDVPRGNLRRQWDGLL